MTYSSRTALRLLSAAVLTTGVTVVVAVMTAPTVDASNTITLTQTWQTYLNDAPCGAVESSPVSVNDNGTPAVEVGDRQGDLYGLNMSDGLPAPGWNNTTGAGGGAGTGCNQPTSGIGTEQTPAYNGVEVPGSPPVDSTASIDPSDGNLLLDAGNAAEASYGGYYAYSPSGSEVWNQVVNNPSTDTVPDGGVQASMTFAPGEGIAEAGSLGQEAYALQTGSGNPAPGWPQFDADSVFSTAAVGDLYGTGADDFVSGGATSSGVRLRHAVQRRRSAPHLQQSRRRDLPRQHDRGGRLVPRRRPDPVGRRPTAS